MLKGFLKSKKNTFKKGKRLFLKQKCKKGFFKSEKTLLKKEKDF